MKKLVVLGMGLCVALAFSSCKSSESAYKKAYEKAKQQELAEAPADQVEATPVEAAPVVSAPVTTAPVAGPVREEKVELVSGDGLKAYSVVCFIPLLLLIVRPVILNLRQNIHRYPQYIFSRPQAQKASQSLRRARRK